MKTRLFKVEPRHYPTIFRMIEDNWAAIRQDEDPTKTPAEYLGALIQEVSDVYLLAYQSDQDIHPAATVWLEPVTAVGKNDPPPMEEALVGHLHIILNKRKKEHKLASKFLLSVILTLFERYPPLQNIIVSGHEKTPSARFFRRQKYGFFTVFKESIPHHQYGVLDYWEWNVPRRAYARMIGRVDSQPEVTHGQKQEVEQQEAESTCCRTTTQHLHPTRKRSLFEWAVQLFRRR